MPQFIINFAKDTALDAYIEAIAVGGGYAETITDENGQEVPNPQNKTVFARQQVKAWMKNQAQEHANRIALMNAKVEED